MSPRNLTIVCLAILTGIGAAVRPLSYDVTYWLVVARRWFLAGDLPYFDVVDNKGPLLYVVMGVADLVPGGPEIAVAVLFVTLIVSISWAAARAVESSGLAPSWHPWIVTLVVVPVAALSGWTLTTELFSAALILLALVSSRPWIIAGALITAPLFDVRSALISLALALALGRTGRLPGRHRSVTVLVLVVGGAAVLAIPEVRFSIVDFSLGNRSRIEPRVFALAALALLPLVVVRRVVGRVSWPRIVWLLLVTALLLAAGSLTGFPHNWTYAVLPLAFVRAQGSPPAASWHSWAVVAAVSVGFALATLPDIQLDQHYARRSDPFVDAVAELIQPSDSVAVWSAIPHLYLPWAEQTNDFAPTSVIWVWNLPNRGSALYEYSKLLNQADVLIVETSFDPSKVNRVAAHAQTLVRLRATEAACSRVIGPITVFRFNDCQIVNAAG